MIKKIIKKIIYNSIFIKLYYKHYMHIYNINSKKNIDEIKKDIDTKYEKIYGKKLDWKNPKTYTEKMNVSKVLYPSDIKSNLTDKIAVREWVKEKIGEEYLIPLIGVYDSFEQIKFDELPEQFVIKCSHDSGSAVVCKDKKKLNLKTLKIMFDFYMKRDYSNVTFESHYHSIEHKIIIEKYMGESINDYKFLCFDSKPYYCWVDFDRFTNHKRNVYDLNWNLQPFNQRNYGNYEKEVKKPSNLDDMIKIVKKLCVGFEQVRVDLYDVDGKIYFGEMTFTNGSGLEPIVPEEYDYELGKLWKFNGGK